MVFNSWATKEICTNSDSVRRDEMEKSKFLQFLCAINVYMMRPNGIRCVIVHWSIACAPQFCKLQLFSEN